MPEDEELELPDACGLLRALCEDVVRSGCLRSHPRRSLSSLLFSFHATSYNNITLFVSLFILFIFQYSFLSLI